MYCASCGAQIEPEDTTAPCPVCGQGVRLAERYVLDAMLGRGGNGTTWRARDVDARRVAIKELPLRLGTPAKNLELFRREADVLQQLHHPGVPEYLDHFEWGMGRNRALYLVMELIEGPSLESRLRNHRFSEAEVLSIMEDLLGILEYLHGLSPPVIHRDMKPANVLCRGESLLLIDFGAVRDVLRDADLGGSTVAGTFGYMAPEQFQGDATPATDLYGLGALAVTLLTRKAPHTIQDVHQRIQWRAHAQVSEGLAALLDRLLTLDPADRPHDASAVKADVQRLINGESVPVVRPPSPDEPSPSPPAVPRAASRVQRGRARLTLTEQVGAPLRAADHGHLVNLIEHVLGVEGDVQVIGDTLRWSTRMNPQGQTRRVRVQVENRGGQTQLLLSENLGGLAGGLYGGLLGGGVGGMAWIGFVFGGVLVGFVSLFLLAALFFLVATGLYRHVARRRTQQLQQLADILQAEIQGSTAAQVRVEDAQPRPIPQTRIDRQR